MSHEPQNQAGATRIVRAFVPAAALAVLALTAYVGTIAESPLAGAVPALGGFGPGKLGQLRSVQLDLATGKVQAGTDRLGRQALASSPLAFEPFLAVAAAGFGDNRAKGSAADAKLLAEALRRNPRSREARYFLMRYKLGAGDLKGAIDQIAVLNRLNSGVNEKLMPALGAAILSNRQVDEAVTALAPYPELLEPFVRGFGAANKPAALRVHLVKQLPRSSFAKQGLRTEAVRLLVGARAFAEARALWGSQGRGSGLVHSPDFTDRKGAPPFNWELKASQTGVAEYDPAGGVAVDYFGRSPGPLLSQLLTLAPGRYQARIQYRTISGTPGALGLIMQCAGSATPLMDQPLSGDMGKENALIVTFTVPQGCGGQLVSVNGRVQESRDPQAAVIRKIEVSAGVGQ